MIWILFPLNFAISWFNAWACGKTWDASRAKGGLAHIMNWMGAVMSASGFTWCYLLIVGFVGSITPMQIFAEEGQTLEGYLFDGQTLQAFYDLGFLAIYFPIVGSGLAITVSTWRSLAQRRAEGQAGLGDYAVTGWNTYAQVSNIYTGVRELPGVFDRLGDFFSGGGSKDKKGMAGIAVILAVILAISGGILTTYSIIQSTRRSVRDSLSPTPASRFR